MPWLDDMKAMSGAIEQASLPQRGQPLHWQSQSRGMRGELMDGIEKGTQPHPFFDLNQEFKEWQSLMAQVDEGRLSLEEAYRIQRQKWPQREPEPAAPAAPSTLPDLPRRPLPGLNREWDK